MSEVNMPRVGVGIILNKGNQVLLLRRKNVHGDGSWSTPGGHLEFGETPEVCAIREAKEETNVTVANVLLPDGGDMNNYLRLIDTNTTGPRYDVTPLFSDYEAFTALVEELARPFADAACDYVAGIDALGFILGTAVALRLQKGFILLDSRATVAPITDRLPA